MYSNMENRDLPWIWGKIGPSEGRLDWPKWGRWPFVCSCVDSPLFEFLAAVCATLEHGEFVSWRYPPSNKHEKWNMASWKIVVLYKPVVFHFHIFAGHMTFKIPWEIDVSLGRGPKKDGTFLVCATDATAGCQVGCNWYEQILSKLLITWKWMAWSLGWTYSSKAVFHFHDSFWECTFSWIKLSR